MEPSIREAAPETPSAAQTYRFEFLGKGSEYFSIMIVNWFLTGMTLGLYYPWARAKRLRYVYGHTALNNERFHFSGTGKEMFFGFIKLLAIYAVLMAVMTFFAVVIKNPVPAVLCVWAILLTVFPFAVHGSLRYRMSRTSYRGIRFGYRGSRSELIKQFFTGVLFTVLTLGIYAAWLRMKIRRYTHGNIAYGDAVFSNNCSGGRYFFIILKGYFLSIFTFGIYMPWWKARLFNYHIDNMAITKNDQTITCRSTATGGGFFLLMLVNAVITVVTFGFGTAWADMRTQKFIFDNIKLEGTINFDEISQTEEEYTNAFGEDMMDFFDIDFA